MLLQLHVLHSIINMFLHLFIVFSISFCIVLPSSMFYDSFRGAPITLRELKHHQRFNTTYWCLNEVNPCDRYEGRRIDGSCNNLKHPTRGAAHTPLLQLLPPTFGPGNQPRTTKNGEKMQLARRVRTHMLAEGVASDLKFTQLMSHILSFMIGDITSIHDTVNYIEWKPYCCLPKGLKDPQCAPIEVPDDDPVHRFSKIRCFNLTRPISFQSAGCLKKDTTPERLTSTTPLFDLSTIYGNSEKSSAEKGRLFRRGLLKYEIDNAGRMWPPSTKEPFNVCYLNQKPLETRCHDGPNDGMNSLIGANLASIWFWREHNRIAKDLSNMNPCWEDEKVFYFARDITIATYMQIIYYELFPALMGRKNLIRDGVISSSLDFRDLYNEQRIPQVSTEFLIAMRWTHTFQEGTVKLFKPNGQFTGKYPIVDLTLKTGFLALGDNIEQMTQGSFRQAGGKIDDIIDPSMSELVLGPLQKASDVATSDLSKNRLNGLPSYTAYLEFCRGRPFDSFESLLDVMDAEKVERLQDLYDDVEDVDMLAGVWVENLVKNGHVPITFYCLVAEHLVRAMVSDRHWYERSERPLAFSAHQLREVRNATIARLICDNGDSVSEIQPRAFERIGPGNKLVRCDNIKPVNLIAWKDHSCKAKLGYHK